MVAKKKAAISKVVKTSKPKKIVKKASHGKQKEVKSGSRYQCGVCGLAVTVDKGANFCDITCCGERMKPAK
jgi:hypothetical protein